MVLKHHKLHMSKTDLISLPTHPPPQPTPKLILLPGCSYASIIIHQISRSTILGITFNFSFSYIPSYLIPRSLPIIYFLNCPHLSMSINSYSSSELLKEISLTFLPQACQISQCYSFSLLCVSHLQIYWFMVD